MNQFQEHHLEGPERRGRREEPSVNDSGGIINSSFPEARIVRCPAECGMPLELARNVVHAWQRSVNELVTAIHGDPLRPLRSDSREFLYLRTEVTQMASAISPRSPHSISDSASIFDSFARSFPEGDIPEFADLDGYEAAQPLIIGEISRRLATLASALDRDDARVEELLRVQTGSRLIGRPTMQMLVEGHLSELLRLCAIITGDVGGFRSYLYPQTGRESGGSDVRLHESYCTELVVSGLSYYGQMTRWVDRHPRTQPLPGSVSALDRGRSDASEILGEKLLACRGLKLSYLLMEGLGNFGPLAVVEIFHKLELKLKRRESDDMLDSQGKTGRGLRREVCAILQKIGREDVQRIGPEQCDGLAKELLEWARDDSVSLRVAALSTACELFPDHPAVISRLRSLAAQSDLELEIQKVVETYRHLISPSAAL